MRAQPQTFSVEQANVTDVTFRAQRRGQSSESRQLLCKSGLPFPSNSGDSFSPIRPKGSLELFVVPNLDALKRLLRLVLKTPQYLPSVECGWRDFGQDHAPLPELPFTQCPCPPRSLPWQGPSVDNGKLLTLQKDATAFLEMRLWFCVCAGYQLRASIYSYGPADTQPSPFSLDSSIRSAEALRGIAHCDDLESNRQFEKKGGSPKANLHFCLGQRR